jgi:hypothetical protein
MLAGTRGSGYDFAVISGEKLNCQNIGVFWTNKLLRAVVNSATVQHAL